ncbi:MAG: ABC-F family ATP-binding cassette domain-containing protein [Candidatus Omnitrophica bacterium]|nr:ABC-F family ATP-binding cassette domain-containing protein [Candidatus Omnitrophota bacterium]
MIYITNLSKSFGDRILFKDLNLNINRNEKIGLVGPNGAGKSTFLALLLGKQELSSGNIQINKNIRIGYLAQESNFTSETTVLSEVTKGDEVIKNLKKEKDTLESQNKAGTARYGEVLHDLEFHNYFELEYKAKKILSGLGFKESDFNRPINHMSGGWQMRTLLAKLLTCQFDILLLDEPSNYLDLNATMWFKEYLAGFKGSFLMISHDKDFLTEVTNYTLILENGLISKVQGNYDKYQSLIEEKRTYLLKQYNEQEKKKEQLQQFIYRFHGQPNKASQVRTKKRMIEKMEEIVVPPNRRESIRNFSFPKARKSGNRVINLKQISKSYDKIDVYSNFDFEIENREKAVLVGDNGAGKSTLLKILAGIVNTDTGDRIVGYNVDIGYFSQTRMDSLSPENTVFEEAYSAAVGKISPENIRTILGAFLFSGDDVEKNITILSGGEKSRLMLAKLLINPPNFLLLDEPTTHLDIDAVDALIKALQAYEGTLVFISHDVHFVRSIANVVYEVKGGGVRKFPGKFDYYWEKIIKESKQIDSELKNKKKKIKDTNGNNKTKNGSWRKGLRNRKGYDREIANKIRILRKEKENLELEQYAKARILSKPRSYHVEGVAKECGLRLKEIEIRLSAIDQEISLIKDKEEQ